MDFSMYDNRNPYTVYNFHSCPRPVANSINGSNRSDRRVVIGKTATQPNSAEIQRRQELERRALTPDVLPGRKNISVQTDLYIETLRDVPLATDIVCQTDAIMDIPMSQLHPPTKCGNDVATQLQVGELFDFYREVKPLIDYLVGRTIEQSLQEVMEEEELARVRTQLRAFHALRNSELAEVQRLHEQERRRREERQRRRAELRKALKKETETAEKIAARAFTREFLANLFPSVFISLTSDGYFYDHVERDLESHFLPWLMTEVNNNLERRFRARRLLDTIVHEMTQVKLEKLQELKTRPITPDVESDDKTANAQT
ncbi:radial spoke head protein 3 homolog B-like [Solea solea]|uniref:radial spoke head protein 3 homolog B-like n=1 Tax=Solea solea TaxID=90069 RepID=UPI00272A167D|nr:radial spoke head protein 3 homolog B-like [Solea solea]